MSKGPMPKGPIALHAETIPTKDLVGMVAARILNARPDLAGFRFEIQFSFHPAAGLLVEVYPAPKG